MWRFQKGRQHWSQWCTFDGHMTHIQTWAWFSLIFSVRCAHFDALQTPHTDSLCKWDVFLFPPPPVLGFCAKQLLHFCSRMLAWEHHSLWRSRRHSHQAAITNTWNTAFMMCLEATDALLSAPLLSHTMQCDDEWGRFTRDGYFARAVKFCNLEIIYFILAAEQVLSRWYPCGCQWLSCWWHLQAEPEVVSVGSQRQIDKSKWKYLSSGWGSCDNTRPCLPPLQLIFSTNGIQGYSNKSQGYYQLIWECVFLFQRVRLVRVRGCGRPARWCHWARPSRPPVRSARAAICSASATSTWTGSWKTASSPTAWWPLRAASFPGLLYQISTTPGPSWSASPRARPRRWSEGCRSEPDVCETPFWLQSHVCLVLACRLATSI